MSDNEFLEFYHSQSEQFKKEMKDVRPAKDLKTFFATIDKKQAG